MNPPTATNNDRDPDPIISLPTELDQFRGQAEGLRNCLESYDPTGELSTLLLVAALHRVDDLFTLIQEGDKADEVLIWTPLRDLPECVTKAGGLHLERVMLVLIAELASDFIHGFRQPDTTIGALALEVILAEAHFGTDARLGDRVSHAATAVLMLIMVSNSIGVKRPNAA